MTLSRFFLLFCLLINWSENGNKPFFEDFKKILNICSWLRPFIFVLLSNLLKIWSKSHTLANFMSINPSGNIVFSRSGLASKKKIFFSSSALRPLKSLFAVACICIWEFYPPGIFSSFFFCDYCAKLEAEIQWYLLENSLIKVKRSNFIVGKLQEWQWREISILSRC